MAESRNLTPKQRLFIAEYLANGHVATKAAISAGYSPKTARSIGEENLTKPDIAAAIAATTGERLAKLNLDADTTIQELGKLAFSNMLDYITVGENGSIKVDLSRLTREQAAAIASVEVEEVIERVGQDRSGKPTFANVRRTKFRLHDKLGALRDLGRHFKLFTDKVEVKGSIRVTDARRELLERLDKLAASSKLRF